MQKITIGTWKIEFDREQTQTIYKTLHTPTQGCTCIMCENYEKAVSYFSEVVLTFFEKLGIDPKKPAEVYKLKSDGETVLYGGFYHIAGKIIKGADIWQPVTKTQKRCQAAQEYAIAVNYAVGFTKEISLLPKDFAVPALQMEIQFKVPWVLSEQNNDK